MISLVESFRNLLRFAQSFEFFLLEMLKHCFPPMERNRDAKNVRSETTFLAFLLKINLLLN